MGDYVQIGELKTWYDEGGQGQPLVLLHGGICTNETWGPQIAEFRERFRVYAPERQGHGHTPDLDGPLSYDRMTANTIGFLETVVREPAHLVGWSDGGIIGLMVAVARPDLVRKLVGIGANFTPDAGAPEAHEGFLSTPADADGLAMLRQMYEASTPDGAEHWPVIFDKFKAMIAKEPNIAFEGLGRIRAPTLVLTADDDLPSIEHTAELFRAIPNAELAVVPGTSHAVLMEKPELANRIILSFLENDPVPTMMPIRRHAQVSRDLT